MGKCKYCKKSFDSYQMKTRDMCNICSYFRSRERNFQRSLKKGREAKTLKI